MTLLKQLRRSLAAVTLAGAVALASSPAAAVEYEIPIKIRTQDDLLELLVSQQISEDTYNVLIEMLQRGVNLDEASREELYTLPNLTYADVDAILAYRKLVERIGDPAALVTSGTLGRGKVANIAPFLEVTTPDRKLAATNGRTRLWIAGAPTDDRVPTGMLQLQLTSLRYLSVGGSVVMTRNRISNVAFTPDKDFRNDESAPGALLADPEGIQFDIPKYYASYERETWGVIVGTYRIGFGQRLTFDASDRYAPNGFYLDNAITWNPGMSIRCKESTGELSETPCGGDLRYERITTDFNWRDGLRGAAAYWMPMGHKGPHLQAYIWGSIQDKDLYQYEVFDRGYCEDPRNDDDPACKSPSIYRRVGDPLEPTSAFKNHTIPDFYQERLVGGNLTYYFSRRAHAGVTGYYADNAFNINGNVAGDFGNAGTYDFQEWSRTPYGGPHGAVGADIAWGYDWFDAFLEGAYSFDSMGEVFDPFLVDDPDLNLDKPPGGGPAAILRLTGTFPGQELEWSTRYYDQNYANPYAGPISQPDQFDGLRARDELGTRLRYNAVFWKKLQLRSLADFWVQPSESIPKLQAFVRGDYAINRVVRPGLWLEFQSRDLNNFEQNADTCFEISQEADEETGEPVPCTGEKFKVIPRVRLSPLRNLTLTAQYTHEWQDRDDDEGLRQDSSLYMLATYRPIDPLRVRARVRYLFEDIEDNEKLEQSLWTYLDVAYNFETGTRAGLRYDFITYMDDRASTQARSPKPEQFLRLEVVQKF